MIINLLYFKKKITTLRSKSKKEDSSRDRFTVVLERMESKIDLLVDGEQEINRRWKRFLVNVSNEFWSLIL